MSTRIQIVALIAPYISVAHPNDFNIVATRHAPSWHHLFGTTDQADGKKKPFHLYSMRQAIQERFILDVLASYTTYATY